MPAPLEEVELTELVVVLAPVCDTTAAEVVAIVDAAVALVELAAIDEEIPESVALVLVAELVAEPVVVAVEESVVDAVLAAVSEAPPIVVTKSRVQCPGPIWRSF